MGARTQDRVDRAVWLRQRVGNEWVSVKTLAEEMKANGLYAPTTYTGDICNSILWSYLPDYEQRSVLSGVYGFEIRVKKKTPDAPVETPGDTEPNNHPYPSAETPNVSRELCGRDVEPSPDEAEFAGRHHGLLCRGDTWYRLHGWGTADDWTSCPLVRVPDDHAERIMDYDRLRDLCKRQHEMLKRVEAISGDRLPFTTGKLLRSNAWKSLIAEGE
ncbi:MAG: hypothetical protein KJO36_06080 [Acidimicrobiia bacterium]|nr:hypothetical protein [Acidimicrobiia bacterium]